MTPADPLTHNGSRRAGDCQQQHGIPKASATPEAELPETVPAEGKEPAKEYLLPKGFPFKLLSILL